ncbi:chitinase [Pseudolysinimonas sp.]
MSALAGRRLSVPRLLIVLGVIGGLVAAGVWGTQWAVSRAGAATASPWFAGYADVTALPSYAFEEPTTDAARNVVLSFVVAATEDGCAPSWGTYYSLDEAGDELDLDRRIARLQQVGGDIAISFGGFANDELATTCTDPDALLAAYRSVVDRYDVSTIDLDIEGDALNDSASLDRRGAALAELQSQYRAADESLAVWLTLPVTPSGLDERGQEVVRRTLAAGVDLAGVNAMTMNYAAGLADGQTLFDAVSGSLVGLQRQLKALYLEQDLTLGDATLWGKIGLTPMIGQNDVFEEVFTLDDARALNDFALQYGVGRASMWSLNRDQTCGSNYVTVKVVSVACSGVDQEGERFADILSAGLDGQPRFSADVVTSDEPLDASELVDDPATSPYPIWEEDSAYLQGTKIVWRRNVYEAKWWTRGDVPDNPVLNEWETSWKLVGPVLPGETPIPKPTLPAGTYPEWSGLDVYERGSRVLFDGVPFEAKWWNQGESPEASSSDPDGSAWVALTEKQVRDVLSGGSGVDAGE